MLFGLDFYFKQSIGSVNIAQSLSDFVFMFNHAYGLPVSILCVLLCSILSGQPFSCKATIESH